MAIKFPAPAFSSGCDTPQFEAKNAIDLIREQRVKEVEYPLRSQEENGSGG